ncbi:uncharacterized protein LOC131889443 [Tigriopus californicus]|uniref:uncharacterized protein LOC131889443 n=1 Tax=Tigriopus californicus TaxID=6832 RepID=UPI0027DA1A2B|nr:uncharacterized protein LOC131889443 [Tigriopus californicus]
MCFFFSFLFPVRPPSEVVVDPSGDATTTLFPEATRNGRHPIGILTSTVDTFINHGTTTEYMTQHLGTYISEQYAKVESTSRQEYFRIQPTAPVNEVQPTGLVSSSTSYEVHGRQTTEHSIYHYRSYIDGHYAQLVSSISKVYSDPPFISATPVYNPNGNVQLGSPDKHGEYKFPGEQIRPSKPSDENIVTRTIGAKLSKPLKLNDLLKKEKKNGDLESELELTENAIRARSIDVSEIVIKPDQVEKKESLPTFTVSEDGELKIPEPSIEVHTIENEIEPTAAHRFDHPTKATKSSLDSVTYIGFVDFTTTIDDTVVMFRPKKTFSTKNGNKILIPKINPTRSISFVPSSSFAIPTIESSHTELPETYRTTPVEAPTPSSLLDAKATSSSINPLKSLLDRNASKRKLFPINRGTGNRPKVTLRPSALPGLSGLSVRPSKRVPGSLISSSKPPLNVDELRGSIDPESDVELVYKTLYTTYTYFTTFFRASTTRVKSREEIISNIVTLTNILDPTDLASLRSSCEVDSTCQFASSSEVPAYTSGFIGRPNSREAFTEQSQAEGAIRETPDTDEELDEDINGILRTFYTTYTYFTTLFVDGTSSISTRTEIYSNIKSSGVPISILSPESVSILATSSKAIEIESTSSPANPRRLEYSSIHRDVALNSELTTPKDLEDEQDQEAVESTTQGSFIVIGITTEAEVTESTSAIAPSSPQEEEDNDEEDEQSSSNPTEDPVPNTTASSGEDGEQDEVTTESQSSDENIDVVSATPAMKTFYTTFTYFTTLFRNGTSFVTSNLETVTNTADATIAPTAVQPSVTFFTTFTYWTTSIDGDNTMIKSSEETRTDVLPASVTDQISIEPSDSQSNIRFSQRPEIVAGISPSAVEDLSIQATATPDLESSVESEVTTTVPITTDTPILESSQGSFEDLDDDFTLSSSVDSTTKGRTFTPVIRPNLFRARTRGNGRPRGSTTTTVAIITRSDVTPTLIATPAEIQATPTFPLSSSRFRSSSFAGRGSARFAASSRGASPIRSSGVSSVINPTPTEIEDPAKPTIISNLRLRRPSPFRQRLKERQRLQLKKLREESNDDNAEPIAESVKAQEEEKASSPSVPVPRFPSGLPGRTPIFISSRTEKFARKPKVVADIQEQEVGEQNEAPKEEEDEETEVNGNLRSSPFGSNDRLRVQRERSRSRINSLFKRRRPSFLRPRPNLSTEKEQDPEVDDPLQVQESRRRKRQASTYAEFGARTRVRQPTSSRRAPIRARQEPEFFDHLNNPPFTAFSGSSNQPNPSSPKSYDNAYDNSFHSSFERESDSTRSSNNVRRQVSQDDSPTLSRSRSRSRFNPNQGRTLLRTRPSVQSTTEPPTSAPRTTTLRRSRFRPRTLASSSRNQNRFSSDTTSSRGTSNRFPVSPFRRPTSPPKTSLFDYDYDYDYDSTTELQSSKNSVPDAITVTHQVPLQTVIPVRENGETAYRDILTTSPSLEVIAATALKSTNIDGSPVIYANAITNQPVPGTKVITFEALRATETTAVVFTPTRIRGLRTSFSHIVPSTIYNIQPVTTEIIQPVDQNQLLSKLLLQLLGGQSIKSGLSPLANPLLQGLPAALGGAPAAPASVPPTQFITHTSTYVTTVTNTQSTVLGITLRGREIKTTLVDSMTEVVTATEYSTETRIAPTSAAAFGGGLNTNPIQTAFPDLQQQLLAAQLQQQLQQQQAQQQQQLLNQQLLSAVNLDTNAAAQLLAAQKLQQQQQLQQQQAQILATQAPEIDTPPPPPEPQTSVVTKFVSGKTPGDFTILTSTVTIDPNESERRKRDIAAVQPSRVERVRLTLAPNAVLAPEPLIEASVKRSTANSGSNVFELQSSLNELGPTLTKDKKNLENTRYLDIASLLGLYSEEEDPRGRDKREERQFQTRLFGDVKVVVKDPYFPEEAIDEPLTLAPKLVRDGFAVQRQSATDLDPSPIVKTEYSTFTYFVTSVVEDSTVTKTDIVVSSNIVTEAGIPEATPLLNIEIQPSSSPISDFATKTYFTTSTYYTTLIDRSTTITKTRTKVESTIVTETFGDENPGQISPTRTVLAPSLIPGVNELKYLSLGPNIYGQIRTLYNTYTYFTTDAVGEVRESKEVITQISTSLFSTSRLPEYITLDSSLGNAPESGAIFPDKNKLSSIKEAFQSTIAPSMGLSLPNTDNDIQNVNDFASSVNLEAQFLNSLKESFASSLSSLSVTPTRPFTDLNLPTDGPEILTLPNSGQTTPGSVSPSQTLSTQLSSSGSSAGGVPGNTAPDEPPTNHGSSQEHGSQEPGAVPDDNNHSVTPGGNDSGNASGNHGNNDVGATSGGQSISGGSEVSNQGIDPSPSSPSTTTPGNGESDGTSSGGVIDAVVGGLGEVFGGATPNVNLGPVLDAVATLLRGPIRSAIANRRSELSKKSDIVQPTRVEGRIKPTANLPAFARIPGGEPNFIPVGGAGRLKPSRPNYEFIPLQQRDVNGPVPLPLRSGPDQASPRIDIDYSDSDDLSYSGSTDEPIVTVPKDVYEALKSQKPDEALFLDDDRLIINDHIIKSTDPHIIDVLNRYEQGHLFGKYEGHPMSIKIVPGLPMTYPSQVGVQGDAVKRGDYVYIGDDYVTASSVGSNLDINGPYLGPPPRNQRPQSSRPRPPRQPSFGPPRNNPSKYPPRGPPPNRPPPPRPLSRPPPPQRPGSKKYPPRPNTIQGELDDSLHEHSTNNEVVVKAPFDIIAQNNQYPNQGNRPPLDTQGPRGVNQGPYTRPGSVQGPPFRPGSNQGPFSRPNSNQVPPNRPGFKQDSPSRPGIYRGQGIRPGSNQGPSNRPPTNQGSLFRQPIPNNGGPIRPGSIQGSRPPPRLRNPNFPPNRPPPGYVGSHRPNGVNPNLAELPPPPSNNGNSFPPRQVGPNQGNNGQNPFLGGKSTPSLNFKSQPGSPTLNPPRDSEGRPLAPPKRQIPSPRPSSQFDESSRPKPPIGFVSSGSPTPLNLQGNNIRPVTPKQPYQGGEPAGFKPPPFTSNEIIPQTSDAYADRNKEEKGNKTKSPFERPDGSFVVISQQNRYVGSVFGDEEFGVSSDSPVLGPSESTTSRIDVTTQNLSQPQTPVPVSAGPNFPPSPSTAPQGRPESPSRGPPRRPPLPIKRPSGLLLPRPPLSSTPSFKSQYDRKDTTPTEFIRPDFRVTTPRTKPNNFLRPRPVIARPNSAENPSSIEVPTSPIRTPQAPIGPRPSSFENPPSPIGTRPNPIKTQPKPADGRPNIVGSRPIANGGRPNPPPAAINPPSEFTPIDNPSDGPPGSQALHIELEPSTVNRPSTKYDSGQVRNPLKARQPQDSSRAPDNVENTNDKDRENEAIVKKDDIKSSVTEIEPSFLATPQGPTSSDSSVPVTKGIFVKPQRGSSNIDYQGWYTEGDSLPPAPTASTSSPYIEYIISEKEAPKTTTYANEWAAVNKVTDTINSNDPFSQAKRPAINTNFDREWTVRDSIINPTRPDGNNLKPSQTSTSSYSNSWGSFVVKTDLVPETPPLFIESEDPVTEAELAPDSEKLNPNQRPSYQTPPPRLVEDPKTDLPEAIANEFNTEDPTENPFSSENTNLLPPISFDPEFEGEEYTDILVDYEYKDEQGNNQDGTPNANDPEIDPTLNDESRNDTYENGDSSHEDDDTNDLNVNDGTGSFPLNGERYPDQPDEGKPSELDERNPVQLDERNPVQLDERNPVQLDERNPVQLDERNPVQLDERNPVQLDERNPVQLGERNPIPFGEGTPVQRGERNPVLLGERDPTQLGERDQTQLGERNPVQLGERNPTQLGERNPTQIGERNPTQLGERNPIQLGERNPTQIGERNPPPFGERSPIQLGDRNPAPFDERNPVRPSVDPFKNPGLQSPPPTPFGPQPRPPFIRNPRPPFPQNNQIPYDHRGPLPQSPFPPHLPPQIPFKPQRPRPRPNDPFLGQGQGSFNTLGDGNNLIAKIPLTPFNSDEPESGQGFVPGFVDDPTGNQANSYGDFNGAFDGQDSEGPIKGSVENVDISQPDGPPTRPIGKNEEPDYDYIESDQEISSSIDSVEGSTDPLPPGVEPDTGTFINIGPSGRVSSTPAQSIVKPSLIRPTLSRPIIRPTSIDTPNVIDKNIFVARPSNRPSIFPPRVTPGIATITRTTKPKVTESSQNESDLKKPLIKDPSAPLEKELETKKKEEEEEETFKLAGSPYLPSIGQKPGNSFKPDKIIDNDDGIKRKEILGNNIDGAIVESIPGKALSAEDSDPETTCQNTCGKNEICQIYSHEIRCKCRPGFGRSSPGKSCEKSRSYQLEVLTKSESEEILVIRMSPQAVQQAVEDTVKREIKDSYHGSEIMSIKIGNQTKREVLFFGGEKNLTKDESMAIQIVVHIADDGRIITDKRLQSILEDPIKDTKLPLGADVTVSRVSVQDFDECSSDDHNDCSDQAQCLNQKGSYTCACKDGYHDLSGSDTLPGRVCSATTTECDLCNRNGECIIRGQDVTCECRDWFAGRNCQINLKLLLIVGCVSVALMIFIACGVSCFCCRDRQKNMIPTPYGTSTVSRIPPSVRSHGLMMDPHGTLKSSRGGMVQKHKPKKSSMTSSNNFIPRPGMKKQGSNAGSHSSAGGMKPAGSWQSGLAPGDMRMHPNPALVIPRARVSKSPGRFSFHSDDEDLMVPMETNRAMSERTSLSSRHRRKSVPSFASGFSHGGPGSVGGASRRSSNRAGSVDPLLAGDGSYSDDSHGGGRNIHRSVSRGDLDRADAQSVARSYNETIIRPVTRPLHTPAATSYRSNRSHATSEDGRTMAERDGGSSFVVSPTHQLYRLHDSDGSLDSL